MYNPGKRVGKNSKSTNIEAMSLIEATLASSRKKVSFKRINLVSKIVLYDNKTHYAVFDLIFPSDKFELVHKDHFYPIHVKNPVKNTNKYTVFTPNEMHIPQKDVVRVYCIDTSNENDKTTNKSPVFYIIPVEGYIKCKF